MADEQVAMAGEQSVTVTRAQMDALSTAMLKAWKALRREGYRPDRIEADWPASRLIGYMEGTVLRWGSSGRWLGCCVEQHDDPGIRMVGVRAGTYKTITVESADAHR